MSILKTPYSLSAKILPSTTPISPLSRLQNSCQTCCLIPIQKPLPLLSSLPPFVSSPFPSHSQPSQGGSGLHRTNGPWTTTTTMWGGMTRPLQDKKPAYDDSDGDVGDGRQGPHQTMMSTWPPQDKWPTDNDNDNDMGGTTQPPPDNNNNNNPHWTMMATRPLQDKWPASDELPSGPGICKWHCDDTVYLLHHDCMSLFCVPVFYIHQVMHISIHLLCLVTCRGPLYAYKCFMLVYTPTCFVRISNCVILCARIFAPLGPPYSSSRLVLCLSSHSLACSTSIIELCRTATFTNRSRG